MPHNKGRNQGKKGNNKKARPQPANTPAAQGNERQPSLLQRIKSKLPTFHKKEKIAPNGVASGAYYEMYKAATAQFHDWISKDAWPHSKMTAVNDYRKGVDQIMESNMRIYQAMDVSQLDALIVAPPDIMASLASSIRLRVNFTSDRFGSKDGGDIGHQYIVEVLQYCHDALLFSNRVAAAARKASGDKEIRVQDAIGGRFNALALDDDLEEDIDWESIDRDIKDGNVPKYVGIEVKEEIDINKAILKGDDRFQAMALLYTMEEFMHSVYTHYDLLKAYMRGAADTHQDSSCVQLLMECAVVANLATESVNRAANNLAIEHPHLSSFYHILALVKMPETIAEINKLLKETKAKGDPSLALQFVAEIIECAFHNRGQDRTPSVVKRFIKKSGLDPQYLEQSAHQIFMLTFTETLFKFEERLNPMHTAVMAATGMRSHAWLDASEYIGGNCCILNTQRIVQMVLEQMKDDQRLTGRPGFWGPSFDEDKYRATRIWGDLDEAFAASIMPELMEICRNAPFQCLPDRENLFTVIDLLHQQVKGDRTRPVPIALTFGLHAVLMSIFALQGDGDLARLAGYAKQSYNLLFEQLHASSDPSKSTENSPYCYLNLLLFRNIAEFAKPVPIIKADQSQVTVDQVAAERLSFWNPLIGGEYMLYATYICSIGLGSATVDSLGQLRFALHLYNGLQIREPSWEVPFLRNIDSVFKDTKAIWVGGKPGKGSCCKVFWMSWGMSASQAARRASQQVKSDSVSARASKNGVDDLRQLNEIRPEEFSASYRCLVKQDFQSEDLENHYTSQSRNTGKSDGGSVAKKNYRSLVNLLTRINITRDAMDDDERNVLPVNFSAVGSILLEFVNALSDHMGWTNILVEELRKNPELRTGKAMTGSSLKGFTASDLNFTIQGLAHFWGHLLSALDQDYTDQLSPIFDLDKIAAFTKSFFEKVEKSRYIFFVKEEKITAANNRNPLEGSYPFGRTGKTMGDPLLGYWSYAFSKRGERESRLVIPGRLTPLEVSEEGLPVYIGAKKLKLGSRGKFRHIASYSLNELLALNWDGSLYVSTRAKHAANGYHVPFIPGYDSDSEDEYEPIDIQRGKQQGTISLSDAQVGLYMEFPIDDETKLVQLSRGIRG
ncbi:hypothetical protein FisN_17Lh147 [Fistulifera solaris]|uniref:DUF6604 domain-containing protein n=1 Tax=Fistulifera solaris TaxID=1519565 RepID=A0A1Z5K8T6_FISSO|nr:hypothetical protein FisN_17Lh147 [Fistulifera solaris]|eukprot:GAX22654.1 hypothetical protein FisN_17Lh147 [Fistulifera solaris]